MLTIKCKINNNDFNQTIVAILKLKNTYTKNVL